MNNFDPERQKYEQYYSRYRNMININWDTEIWIIINPEKEILKILIQKKKLTEEAKDLRA